MCSLRKKIFVPYLLHVLVFCALSSQTALGSSETNLHERHVLYKMLLDDYVEAITYLDLLPEELNNDSLTPEQEVLMSALKLSYGVIEAGGNPNESQVKSWSPEFSSDYWLQLGHAYYDRGDYKKAVEAWSVVEASEPDLEWKRWFAAYYDPDMQAPSAVPQVSPQQDLGALLNVSIYQLERQQSNQAQAGIDPIDILQEISDLDVASNHDRFIQDYANLLLGFHFLRSGQIELGRRHFSRIRRDSSLSSRGYVGLAWTEMTSGNYEAARRVWDELARNTNTMLGIAQEYHSGLAQTLEETTGTQAKIDVLQAGIERLTNSLEKLRAAKEKINGRTLADLLADVQPKTLGELIERALSNNTIRRELDLRFLVDRATTSQIQAFYTASLELTRLNSELLERNADLLASIDELVRNQVSLLDRELRPILAKFPSLPMSDSSNRDTQLGRAFFAATDLSALQKLESEYPELQSLFEDFQEDVRDLQQVILRKQEEAREIKKTYQARIEKVRTDLQRLRQDIEEFERHRDRMIIGYIKNELDGLIGETEERILRLRFELARTFDELISQRNENSNIQ